MGRVGGKTHLLLKWPKRGIHVHPLILVVQFNQRAVDYITGDSGHPNYELLLSKTLLDIIDLQRPVLLGFALHRIENLSLG